MNDELPLVPMLLRGNAYGGWFKHSTKARHYFQTASFASLCGILNLRSAFPRRSVGTRALTGNEFDQQGLAELGLMLSDKL